MLLISSAVIATLGLISNSTAVVIGAMIVAPLMDSILSLAFGLAVSDGQLIRRSAVTVTLGVTAVVSTSAIISLLLGIGHVQSEITARTSPNLIDLGIAVAAAVGGVVFDDAGAVVELHRWCGDRRRPGAPALRQWHRAHPG